MEDDPGIAWIRKVRHKISAEFGHDPKRLVEHYIKLSQDRALQRCASARDRCMRPLERPGPLEAGFAKRSPQGPAREDTDRHEQRR